MVTLETERLIIRDNIPGDLHDLYELTTDEHSMRFMKSTKIETRKEAKKNLKISIRESKRKTGCSMELPEKSGLPQIEFPDLSPRVATSSNGCEHGPGAHHPALCLSLEYHYQEVVS